MIFLDFETRSEADLLKVGAYKYVTDPSTEVLCLAWAVDDERVVGLWHPAIGDFEREAPFPDRLTDLIAEGEPVEAHNAYFERLVWHFHMVERFGWPAVQPEQWRCSASVCAAFAMRRKLEHAAKDLGLIQQKDTEGPKIIRRVCKPRKAKTGPRWNEKRKDLIPLFRYCVQDVRTERAVSKALRPLQGDELRTWQLDQAINLRGIHVDLPMAKKALEIGQTAKAAASAEIEQLTGGEVTAHTQRERFKQWLRERGVEIPTKIVREIDKTGLRWDVEKETIGAEHLRGLLEERIPEDVARAIEVWLAANKSSVAKYQAIVDRTADDHRVRETLRYHGATTGRWAGAGIQPHNFPRNCPDADEMERACTDVRELEFEDMQILYGEDAVLPTLSKILRGAITAGPGNELVVADFSAIEARGTFWVADHRRGLDEFRRVDREAVQAVERGEKPREDIYTVQASKFHGREITKADKDERQHGKVVVLGCGYQMSWRKLIGYAEGMGVRLSEEQARWLVNKYREENAPVKELWYELEQAAVEAVRRGPKKPPVEAANGKLKWAVRGAFLHCRLSNGRLLSYFRPALEWDDDFGRMKLTFLGYVTGKPGLWARGSTYGGKLTENVVQAICRDVMRDAMFRCEERGYKIVLTVHDEIIAEVPEGFGSVEEFEALLCIPPEWAEGLPIVAEGWRRKRYGKE